MRDIQRDQPAADSRVMTDRQIHQPAADTLLPRPANTNVDPVITRSATTSKVDLDPSIKGQGHQELFQDPANHQPSLAHLSTLSQHQQVPNTSHTIHTLPTANYPSVHAFTTSDPPYQNTTRYHPVCAPTQRNDNVHYQSPNNPAAPLTWGLSPSTYYQPLANQLPCHQTFYPVTNTTNRSFHVTQQPTQCPYPISYNQQA